MIYQTHPHPLHDNLQLIEYPDDAQKYQIQKGQKWRPLSVRNHPALPVKVGDILTLSKFLSKRYGLAAAFVSGTRYFKEHRTTDTDTYFQVELLGIPREWFALGHFKEHYLQHPRIVCKYPGVHVHGRATADDFY